MRERPTFKRPAVEGLPAVRLRCIYCDKPMPYVTRDTGSCAATHYRPTRRVFAFWRGYGTQPDAPDHPLFDRLSCSLRFAEAAYRGGYRVVRS